MPEAWWRLFRSRPLDRLVRRGITANLTVAQAESALRQARIAIEIARAPLLPDVGASLSRAGGGPVPGGITGSYGAGLGLSYGPDLFGGVRRNIEAQVAAEDAAVFRLQAARLDLTTAIVVAAIEEAGLRAEIEASEAALRRSREGLALVRVRHAAGAEPVVALLSQESLIRSQEGALVALGARRDQTRHRLAILIGAEPGGYDEPGFILAGLTLPRRLPLYLPAKLVGRRPDILAAAAGLHSASASIGVATANLLPNVSLSGNLGVSGAALATLASSASWGAGLGVAQVLFDAGARTAQRDAAVERYETARIAYRATVLEALRTVADLLSQLAADGRRVAAAAQAEDLARQALAAAEVQYRAGALGYLDLLSAQTRYADATLARLHSEAARLTDTASLFQALGGNSNDASIL